MNLYKILHINEARILSYYQNINNIADYDLKTLNDLIQYVNRFHSYFHFEQSFAYSLCAFIYHRMNKPILVDEFISKALFQDHTNPIALNFKNPTIEHILSYDRHIMYEDDFLDFALGDHVLDELAEYLDYEILKLVKYFKEKPKKPLYKIKKKPLPGMDEKWTHRLGILHSLNQIKEDNIANAIDYALMAARNLEDSHEAYHKYASDLYKRRAEAFKKICQWELAENDLLKSEDLFPSFS